MPFEIWIITVIIAIYENLVRLPFEIPAYAGKGGWLLSIVWIWRDGIWIRGRGYASRGEGVYIQGEGVCIQGEGGLHPRGLHPGGMGSASVGMEGSASAVDTSPSSRYMWCYGIWSTSAWYTYYCNAFLCFKRLTKISYFWRLKN